MTLPNREKQRRSLKKWLQDLSTEISWPTRISGVLVSILSMHMLVVRPLVDQVDQLQAELNYVDDTLAEIAGQKAIVSETNDLLSHLRLQHEEIAGARAAFRQLNQLTREVTTEVQDVPAALDAVKRMGTLPDQVMQLEADRYSQLSPVKPNQTPLPQELSTEPPFYGQVHSEPARLDPDVLTVSRQLANKCDSGAGDWKILIQSRE